MKLLSCGDALIDFLPSRTAQGAEAFAPLVGGSCLNVAIAMARLGAAAGFVGALSTDGFGAMIADHAVASGVDLRMAARLERPSTLAFARVVEGEARYMFYDEGSAASTWTYRAGSVDANAIAALHVGSTTLVRDHGAAQAQALIAELKGRATIAFDPNCRPHLVADRAIFAQRMARFADDADLVRMSDADFAYLHGHDDHDAGARRLLEAGVGLVVVTCGARGALAWGRAAGRVEVAAAVVDVVDTIGAGDSFQGALLVALAQAQAIAPAALAALDAAALRRALAFAARCAALTCSRGGADPPWKTDVGAAV